jgi:hypothetical protein
VDSSDAIETSSSHSAGQPRHRRSHRKPPHRSWRGFCVIALPSNGSTGRACRASSTRLHRWPDRSLGCSCLEGGCRNASISRQDGGFPDEAGGDDVEFETEAGLRRRRKRRQHAMFTKVRKASRSVLMPESFAAFALPPTAVDLPADDGARRHEGVEHDQRRCDHQHTCVPSDTVINTSN